MIDEATEHGQQMLRTTLAIAGQVGSRLLEARNQRLRDIRVQAEQAAREQQRELERSAREQERQLQAQRTAEIGSLRPVGDPAWWENATPDDIAKKWETATAWAPVDERARDAAAGMVQNVQERYGIDLNRLHETEDPAAVLTGVREVATERAAATRLRAEAERDDARAQALLAEAAAYDQLAREQRALADDLQSHINWDDPNDRDLRIFDRAEQASQASTALEHESDRILAQAERAEEESLWRAGHAAEATNSADLGERDLINRTDQSPITTLADRAADADDLAAANRRQAENLAAYGKGPLTPDVPHDVAEQAAGHAHRAAWHEQTATTGRDRAGDSSTEARAALNTAEAHRQDATEWASPERLSALRASMTNSKIDPQVIQHRMVSEHARPQHPAKAARGGQAPKPASNGGRTSPSSRSSAARTQAKGRDDTSCRPTPLLRRWAY